MKIRRKKRRHGTAEDEDGLSRASSRKRHRGGKKKARLVATLSIIWILLIAAVAIAMHALYPENREQPFVQQESGNEFTEEDRALLNEGKAEIGQAYMRFIADSSPSSRSVQILRGPENLSGLVKMSGSTSELAYSGKATLEFNYLVKTPVGKGIVYVVLWDDGQKVEMPFFQEEEHWKIDWQSYARYSPAASQWPLFVAGGGDEEAGEYRVFARQRAETGFVPPNQMALSLSLPKFGKPGETTNSSPQVIVDRDSEIGVRLQKAFDAREKSVDIFGNKLVEHDPDGQIRIRAKISRQVDGDKKVFKIQELLASHWFDCGDEPAADAAAAKP